MHKILILVEGQTEENFIKKIIKPYLKNRGIEIIPILSPTGINESGLNCRGGLPGYEGFKKLLRNLLDDSAAGLVTTMIDYYGLPGGFPAAGSVQGNTSLEKVKEIESLIYKDIEKLCKKNWKKAEKFFPYLSLHEFETLLFVSTQHTARAFPDNKRLKKALDKIMEEFRNPEEINQGKTTHPSARLKKLIPEYQKAFHGPLALADVDLDIIRSKCPHFKEWIDKMENPSAWRIDLARGN
jgi:hypothetical protein